MPVLLRVRPRRIRVKASAFKALAHTLLKVVGESRAELGVELVGDRRMRALNRRYRGHDAPTDVLAFAIREGPGPVSPLLGDVVISLPTAARQAARHGRSIDEEIATLLIHGLLHLCGYDHERGAKEARRMRRKEQAVWKAVQPIPELIAGDKSRRAHGRRRMVAARSR